MKVMYKVNLRLHGVGAEILKVRIEKETEKMVSYYVPEIYGDGSKLRKAYKSTIDHRFFNTFDEAKEFSKGFGERKFENAMADLKRAETYLKQVIEMEEGDCRDITEARLRAAKEKVH